jgi:catechol 2,3-dioxygenase-like lactoylglutathione lyase family enzyme
MSYQYRSAVLFVRDIAASRHFYETLLGQQVMMDHGPNVGFAAGFAIFQLDYALQTILGEAAPQGQPGKHNFELYFEADDITAAWEALSAAGVAVVHPLREQPWGQRVLRVYDPDGHIVEVGEPMPAVIMRFLAEGLSPEAIAQRTAMPLDIVQQVASTV